LGELSKTNKKNFERESRQSKITIVPNHADRQFKCHLNKTEEVEYVPPKSMHDSKKIGVGFNDFMDTQKKYLIAKLKSSHPGCLIYDKPSDQLDVLVTEDNKVTPLLLLALARGCHIVKSSYIYETWSLRKSVNPSHHEVSYFPKKFDRHKTMRRTLDNLKIAIDVFGRSNSHPFLGEPTLEYVVAEMGAKLVRRITDADFIVSDKREKLATSTIFKKVHYEWLTDSLLKNQLQPVQDYYF
jgi:hypothetical protein